MAFEEAWGPVAQHVTPKSVNWDLEKVSKTVREFFDPKNRETGQLYVQERRRCFAASSLLQGLTEKCFLSLLDICRLRSV